VFTIHGEIELYGGHAVEFAQSIMGVNTGFNDDYLFVKIVD